MINLLDCVKVKNPKRWWFKHYGKREMMHAGRMQLCHNFRLTYVHPTRIAGLNTTSLTSHLEIADDKIVTAKSADQFIAKMIAQWVDGLKAQLAKHGIDE